MEDLIKYDLWKSILGLSLIILGLFTMFFVKFIPLSLGVLIAIVGVAVTIYYFIKLINYSFKFIKQNQTISFKNIFKKHYPVILSIIVLLLVLVSFVGAATIQDGTLSVAPNSRKLVLYTSEASNTIAEKGPYTVDAALENETDMIRMPYYARETLGLSVNDTITINGNDYTILQTRDGEAYILRLPIVLKTALNVSDGDNIRDSQLSTVFNSSIVKHSSNINDNLSIAENYMILTNQNPSATVEVFVDNSSVYKTACVLEEGNNYNIAINGASSQTFTYNGTSLENSFTFENHNITIKIDKSSSDAIKKLFTSSEGIAINIILNN